MKLPRKGILIRLAIYLPLIIGLLIWQLFFNERPQPQPESPAPSKGKVHTFEGPEGKEFKVIEITPEQAKEMGVQLPEKPAPAKAE